MEKEVTLSDIDKAIASIPAPQTLDDYNKTYTIYPGGVVIENPRPPKVELTIEEVEALVRALGLDI